MGKRSTEVKVLEIFKHYEREKIDELVHEEEIVIKVNGEIHKFYCIPVSLEEMIAGNLKSRGLDPSLSQVKKLSDSQFVVNISEKLVEVPQRCDSKKKVTRAEVFESVKKLNENSFLYRKTGCTHVVGILGNKEVFVEDVSRHCAVDKAIGLAIKEEINLQDSCLVSSCRQTASTLRKAIFCQIPIVISIAAPTDLAVEEANKYGITLIGFAGSERFNVYSHDWRVEI